MVSDRFRILLFFFFDSVNEVPDMNSWLQIWYGNYTNSNKLYSFVLPGFFFLY